MTELNPILTAMNNIDDNIITNAEKTNKKPIFLRVGIIAAAALVLAVGIHNWSGRMGNYISPADSPVNPNGVSYEASDFESTVLKNHAEFIIDGDVAYDYNLAAFDITIPDEYKPESGKYSYYGVIDDIGIEELCEKFNVPLFINDNFSAEVDPESADIPTVLLDDLGRGTSREYTAEPCIMVYSDNVTFSYYLYDKVIDRNVNISALYLTNECVPGFTHQTILNSEIKYETVMLKDGARCFIEKNHAYFVYNGVYYDINWYTDGSAELTKQVLTDLGVL